MIFLRSVGFLAFLVLVAEARTYISRHQLLAEEPEFLELRTLKEHSLLAGTHADNHEHKRDVPNDGELQHNLTLAMETSIPAKNALLARYIVNQADWTVMATISARQDIVGYPTAGLVSYCDGLPGNGPGIPYFYLTPRDFIFIDLNKDNNRTTLFMSLAQGDYCQNKELDPFDPRCGRVMLTGTVKAVDPGSHEHATAQHDFFVRHPKLIGIFPPSHHFFLAKLEIKAIMVMGAFRGPKNVTIEDYFHPPVGNVSDGLLTLSG